MATRNTKHNTWLYFGLFLAAVVVVLYVVRTSQSTLYQFGTGPSSTLSTSDDVASLEKDLTILQEDPVASDVNDLQTGTQ